MTVNIEQSVFEELADFIVSQPTLEEIAAYRVSEETDNRIHYLLEKNREEGLDLDEREEMTQFLTISHLMKLAKAKAHLQLKGQR